MFVSRQILGQVFFGFSLGDKAKQSKQADGSFK